MSDAGRWATDWAATAGWLATAVAALLAGAALGGVFFGGLWWTVRRGAVSAAPVRWFLGSLVLRTAFVLFGFHLVGAGDPVRLGLCLAGFALARFVVLRAVRRGSGAVLPPRSGAPPCA